VPSRRLAIVVPPTITSDPVDRTTVLGGSVTFTVSATGTAPLTYQWRKNSIDIFRRHQRELHHSPPPKPRTKPSLLRARDQPRRQRLERRRAAAP
jgi:hypothetical protein